MEETEIGKTIESEKLPSWMEGFKPEKVEKSAEAGEIYPKLRVPNIREDELIGKSVKVELLDNDLKVVESEKFKYGTRAFVTTVRGLEDGIIYFCWCPDSLRFKMGVLFKRLGKLKGLKVAIWKEKTELAEFGDSVVYNAQVIKEEKITGQ